MLNPELLSVLVCPVCRAKVEAIDQSIVCANCARRYPIRAGIPIMLADEAEAPDSDPAREPRE